MRTAKLNTAFTDTLQVGATDKTVTLAFYKDGVAVADPTHTVAEISDTGLYKVAIAGGFTGVGHWLIVATWDSSTLYRDVEVTSYTIDNLYTLLGGGTGNKTVTLTVQDTASDPVNAPVADLRINVWNSAATTYITTGLTNASGQVTFLLDQATYKLKMYKAGVATTETDLVVGATTPQATTLSVVGTAVSAPSTPSACRLYGDFVMLSGAALNNFRVSVQNLYSPTSSLGLGVVQDIAEYSSNTVGHVEFDVVQGTKVKVSFVTTGLVREIVVPATSTSNLLTLMGTSTDPFVVQTV